MGKVTSSQHNLGWKRIHVHNSSMAGTDHEEDVWFLMLESVISQMNPCLLPSTRVPVNVVLRRKLFFSIPAGLQTSIFVHIVKIKILICEKPCDLYLSSVRTKPRLHFVNENSKPEYSVAQCI